MCGFVGLWEPEAVEPRVLLAMTRSLAHRGPDDEALVFLAPKSSTLSRADTFLAGRRRSPFGMGFRRLSVLDVSLDGRQPMQSADERWAITFNGEVYNFQELREELIAQGHRFVSRTDTEVILALYQRLGPAMLERLNGMFAIAIMDAKRQELFLARDRMGIKPLYYYATDGRFLYASEIKAFLYHPAFRRRLNIPALDEYMLFRCVASPHTLLDGVKSVEPGTYLMVRSGQISHHRYWQIPPAQPDGHSTAEALSEELEALMRSSVRYRLISDVPVGCQLSGGVDSSLIAGWAAEQHHGPFNAISVVLPGSALNEEPYMDAVSRRLGLVLHKLTLNADDMRSNIVPMMWHSDLPALNPNSVGLFQLSAEAKRHVTVMLTGEGSDEVFGGYARYAIGARLISVPAPIRQMLVKIWRPHLAGSPDLAAVLMGLSSIQGSPRPQTYYPHFSQTRALASRRRIWDGFSDSDPLERMLSYEQRTYLVELLLRQDRMSMAHGIESRVPFLDHRIVEFAKRLPMRFKVRQPWLLGPRHAAQRTKWIMKRLAVDRLGRQVVYRPKEGFRLPMGDWFGSGRLAPLVKECRQVLERSGLFEMTSVDSIFCNAQASSGASAHAWTLMSLSIWMRIFLEQSVPSKSPSDFRQNRSGAHGLES